MTLYKDGARDFACLTSPCIIPNLDFDQPYDVELDLAFASLSQPIRKQLSFVTPPSGFDILEGTVYSTMLAFKANSPISSHYPTATVLAKITWQDELLSDEAQSDDGNIVIQNDQLGSQHAFVETYQIFGPNIFSNTISFHVEFNPNAPIIRNVSEKNPIIWTDKSHCNSSDYLIFHETIKAYWTEIRTI